LQTGQKTSYVAGDDGALQEGVIWPNPRFAVVGNCVKDTLTRLMWVRNPEVTTRSWADSLFYARGLNACGYTDWRIPNVKELRSLVNYEYVPNNWLNDPAQGFGSSTTSS
jgi:Protein of unknown function (DUF1566)